jgi:hypothetical protein
MTLRRSFRRHARREPLSAGQRAFLCHGIEGNAAAATVDEHLARRGEALGRVWRAHKSEILPDFIRAHPGQRPWAWWRYDAPEPRRRLGGVGTPCHEVLAYEPEYDFGVPARWVTARMVEHYREGGFRGVAIDPRDPPRFESEPSYLRRHELLLTEEHARLTPTAFTPETVELDHEEEDIHAER